MMGGCSNRVLTRVESLFGVFMALLLPGLMAGGTAMVEMTAMVLR